MPLSWNEIKSRAVNFSKEWSGEQREGAEAQTFWNAFFDVFGVKRRTVATFEEKVRNIKGRFGYIRESASFCLCPSFLRQLSRRYWQPADF